MLAEVVTVGDEVCRGEILDSNSAFLAAGLWDLDVTVAWMTSCRDDAEDMRDAIARAADRSDIVVITGGLGPTSDDLTVDVLSSMVGVEPVIDPVAKERMDARTRERSYRAPNMERQVRVPEGARVHINRVGLAPAFEVRLGTATVICLPGPPRELKPIFDESLRPRIIELREARGDQVQRIARRIYRVFGKGESQIAGLIEGVCDDIPGASLHFQVKFPSTFVKIVVRDQKQEAAEERLRSIDNKVRSKLGDYIYGIDDQTLEEVVGVELKSRGLTLATAESCTGGMIGAMLTSVSGSSTYYLGGAVTYSNDEKVRQLGVSRELLDEHGAVSEQCVVAMSKGIRERSGADIGVAVSGIAGPSGGTDDKPVGTVWLAVASGESEAKTRKLLWPSTRDMIRSLAAHAALAMVLDQIRGVER